MIISASDTRKSGTNTTLICPFARGSLLMIEPTLQINLMICFAAQ